MKEIILNKEVSSVSIPESQILERYISNQREICKSKNCKPEFINFALDQSPFPVPQVLQKTLSMSTENGSPYNPESIRELKIAISNFNNRRFSLNVSPDRVVIGSGTTDLIYTLFSILDSEIIIPSPSFSGYTQQLNLMKKIFYLLPLKEENF